MTSNYSVWKSHCQNSFNEILNNCYSHEKIAEVFSWTKNVRAGIILIYDNNVLLVKERGRKITNSYHNNIFIAERFGIPKGEPIKTDKNIFMTALRELKEETGINIVPKKYLLCKTSITIERNEKHLNSVHIYFIVFATLKPTVIIRNREIVDYMWYPIHSEKLPDPTNKSCDIVLNLIKTININSFKVNSV